MNPPPAYERTPLKQRVALFYSRHELALSVGFFLGGFLFDVLTLSEIDNPFTVGQQILYLYIIGWFIIRELYFSLGVWAPSKRWATFWPYRQLLTHFLLGSLLSVYSLFFLKSASLSGSLAFVALIMGILVANELPWVQKAGVGLKVALHVLCLFSFFSMMWPVALGFVGWTPFALSVLSTGVVVAWVVRRMAKRIPHPPLLRSKWVLPSVATLALSVLFYTIGWIPPVPLCVERMGIYHMVEKKGDRYVLHHERPRWAFWRRGDQDFVARPGEAVYFFAQVYSPARFSDRVTLHWMYRHPRSGWITSDRIPMNIVGGRREGFRGFSFKKNHQEGRWRVQVETTDGREIGRLGFRLRNSSEPPDPTRFRQETS